MMSTRLSHLFKAVAFPIITACPIFANETPDLEPHHAAIETITLFAGTPDIVTPVGVAVAPDGRVFVQENHTHKRTRDYEGPEKDLSLIHI